MSDTDGPSTGSFPSVAPEAKRTMTDAAEEAKTKAKGVLEDATGAAASQAQAAKASAADEISGFASALRTAAREMREGSPQERTFGQIAESLADASDALRDKDLGTMVEDVTGFARRKPLAFLGGAALVGFAATRFARASVETKIGSGTTGSGRSVTPATTRERLS